MVALRYSLLAVALLLVLPISIGMWPDARLFAAWPVYLSTATFAFIVALLRHEARRDLGQLCVFWVLAGFVMTMVSLATLHDRPWMAWLGLLLSSSTWVASLVMLAWRALAKDTLPNPMLERFDKSRVFEVDGVQLACELADASAAARGTVDLRLSLLNCLDRERTVGAKLTARFTGLGIRAGASFDDAAATVTLPPGGFGVWLLPCRVVTQQAVSIFVNLDVTGAEARRLYRRRAQAIPMYVHPFFTVAVAIATFGTRWLWGGGLRIRIPAHARTPDLVERVRRWSLLEDQGARAGRVAALGHQDEGTSPRG